MEEALLSPAREERVWRPTIGRGAFAEELKRLSFMAAPMVVVTVSQYLLQVVSLMMVGHLGELSLSGVAIAVSFTNVTGFSLLVKFSFLYPLLFTSSLYFVLAFKTSLIIIPGEKSGKLISSLYSLRTY